MSGGYFDYEQYKMGRIADEVEQLIINYFNNIGTQYSIDTINKFIEAKNTLRKAEIMAQRIDWLVSGNDGEDSFHGRWKEELEKLESG